MKKCTKCKEEKFLEQFPKNKKTLDKLGSWCRECHSKLKTPYYQKNKDRLDLKTNEWNRKHPDKIRGYRLNSIYGIKESDYQVLLKNQNNSCLICKKHESSFDCSLAIDHCHKTGKIRGLLCKSCNLAIGLLEDSVESLNNAIIYLNNQ